MEDNSKKSLRKSKAPPVIRQTRTSAYRILKSNPLMMYDRDSIKKMGIEDPQKIPKSVDVLGISSSHSTNTQAMIESSTINVCNLQQDTLNTDLCKNKSFKPKITHLKNDLKRLPNFISKKSTVNKNAAVLGKDNNLKSKKIATCTSVSTKALPRKSISAMYREQKRRSRSAERFDPSKCFKRSAYEEANSKLEICHSMENIPDGSLLENNLSPIKEKRKITFKTPSAYDRRSILQCTPSTGRKYKTFCSTPASSDLQKRLNDWLTKRGKSLGSFHHLKCFGLHESKPDISKIRADSDENKENMTMNGSNNPEITLDGKEDHVNIENKPLNDKNYNNIARDALDDLHKLIQDGYPLDQCELWLSRIRYHYHSLDDEPLYWECRAALEQCRGNISSAVEHYRKAIVKGAEVNTIEDSLEQLLQKFSLLNIDPDLSERDTKNRKVILEARNVFKATIIQFAVQERMLKKNEEETKRQIIVTPVRRSTRLSMKHSHNSTIKLCASIKEIDMNENTQFHTNSYLSIRFSP